MIKTECKHLMNPKTCISCEDETDKGITQSWSMNIGSGAREMLGNMLDSYSDEVAKLKEKISDMESDMDALNEYIAHLEQRLRDKVK